MSQSADMFGTEKHVECTSCLGDSHSSTKTQELYPYEKQQSTTSDPAERLIRWYHGPVADEIVDLSRDPIGIQGIEPHIPAGRALVGSSQSRGGQRTTIQQAPLWVSKKEYAEMGP
jgi:hypothetical protein